MNPLHWKREHQTALLLGVSTGALIGLFHGVRSASPIWGRGVHDCTAFVGWILHPICNSFAHDWSPISGWPLFGGFFGGAIIYIWQLMRS
jgi:hypothetical protein